MPKFHESIKVNASPDRAWAIVGDLAGVDKWIPGCTDVKVEGTKKRICTFVDGHVQHEEIRDYSDERRSYRYAIEGIPGIKNNRGSFAVKGDGTGAVIVWDSEFEAIERAQEKQIVQMWEGAIDVVSENLHRLIEG